MIAVLKAPKSTCLAAALLLSALLPAPLYAASKEMIQLQTQIQQLQDAVARLQQSNDERMGVLKDLVQQSADSVNRMSLNMDALQKQMRLQQEGSGAKLDQVSTQVQALNDSLDEMKTRLARLDKATQDIQSQQQTLGNAVQGISSGNPSSGAGSLGTGPSSAQPLGASPPPASGPGANRKGKPSAGIPLGGTPATPAAPPADDLYKTAFGDYMAANYPLASAEFSDLVRAYPDNSLAGNAFYYLGEIDYRKGRYGSAAQNYDRLLEQFPGNSKIPAAHLHKAQALFTQKQDEAGIRELRALINRFPTSPEATQARAKLTSLGVSLTPRK